MQEFSSQHEHLSEHANEDEPPKKKPHFEHSHLDDVDIKSILSGEKLTDLHIHLAQQLLKQQFPHLNGLQPTVLQTKKNFKGGQSLPNQLQVVHFRGDHWILATSIGCRNGDVSVYDSVYRSIDEEACTVITNLFQSSAIEIVESPKQEGGTDCGVFAIATATALVHGVIPSSFNQSAMRRHLVDCFKNCLMTLFPCS